MNRLLVDFLKGGILSDVISRLSHFSDRKQYYEILGFLWALPITLPFLLHIVRKESTLAGVDTEASFTAFFSHAAVGFVLAIALIVAGIPLSKRYKPSSIVYAYSVILAVICAIYFTLMK